MSLEINKKYAPSLPEKKKRKKRRCCACKKRRKIINVGGPPLCKDCYPLACNWSKELEKYHKFMRSIASINPVVIDIGRKDDDLTYFLEYVAEDLADAKLKLKQAEICLINVCTVLRNEGKITKSDIKKIKKLDTGWEPIK